MKNRFIPILFFLALASGIVWGMPFDKPLGSDARGFDRAASVILEEGIFNNSEFMNQMIDRIFYSYFLAGVYKIFGHYPVAVKIIQLFIFAGLVLLIYKLCQQIFNERIARLAGFITALCYSIASFTSSLYREMLFSFLIFLLVYCLYQAQKKKKAIWFIVSGIVFAIASITNVIIQFFILVIIINFLILNRKGLRKIVPKIALFLLSFILVISPLFISYYLNFGRTPFGSRQGLLLMMRVEKMYAIKGKYIQHLIGNATGDFFAQKLFSDYNPDEARLGWNTREEWKRMINEEGRDRKEVDWELTNKAVKEIIKHPILFLEMSSLDFLKFNTPMVPDVRMQHMFAEPDSHPEFSDLTKGFIILMIRFVYLIFAIFIVYAIVKNIRDWSKMGWIILIVFYFNLIFSNLHAIARYSIPVYPFYIILLTIGCLMFWDNLKNEKPAN